MLSSTAVPWERSPLPWYPDLSSSVSQHLTGTLTQVCTWDCLWALGTTSLLLPSGASGIPYFHSHSPEHTHCSMKRWRSQHVPPALLSSHLLQGHGSLVQPVSMPWLQSGKVSSLPCVPTHERMYLNKAGRAWAHLVRKGAVFGPLGHGGACDKWRPSWCLPTMLSHSPKAPASTKEAEHAHRRPPAWSSCHRCEVPLKSCILSQK